MAIAIAEAIGPDLIRAIGPAQGIGRPRWDALAKAIEETGADRDALIRIAEKEYTRFTVDAVTEGSDAAPGDPSVMAFEAVFSAVAPAPAHAAKPAKKARTLTQPLTVDGRRSATLRRTAKGLSLELPGGGFADWLEAEAQNVIEELHARWQSRGEE